MYTKIYFNDKPLFLCDQISEEIAPFERHGDTVFIDELSSPAVNSMIHEMQLEKVHAGIILHTDLEKLKLVFWKKFVIVQAGGGLVENEREEILFMFRRGKWDLPKGKLNEGESIEECALREVSEETGLTGVQLQQFLLTTYHTYIENGKSILKETHWYRMVSTSNHQLVPQTEEDIQELKWVKRENLSEILNNTYPSIRDVIQLKD